MTTVTDPRPLTVQSTPSHRWPRRLGFTTLAVAALAAALLLPLDAGTTRIVNTIDIARSPSQVYDYVTTPGNWPQWHPSSLGVSGAVDHSLQVGEEVTEDFKVAGRTGRVTWRAVARETDRSWRIAGRIDGRDAGVVSYTLEPTATGTHFVREFSYGVPNLLFAVMNAALLRARIQAESAQALAQLESQVEALPADR